ncbi:RHS repeat-associated core domain-containing protein [Streptomyces sp. NBC_00687]|uniref:RHS repeat-associated core domain-containing protein n=1 Tax=Streptomyces sp. NBC_00687 TaxID=2975807 RepID=UPI00224F7A77|nr:RHS repeat-associated core domain-containing protein [Streptomyces sp. NBC_00687]MCX4911992.1 polymorphic toxin-type HINT domain-containing protein [Streptomyces sp. NBC_00687]
MAARRARFVSVGVAGAVLAGLLSTMSVLTPQEAMAAASDPTPVVPSQSLGTVPAQQAEETGTALPTPRWPSAAEVTVDLSQSAPGETGTVTPSPSVSGSDDAQVADVVEVAPAPPSDESTTQLTVARQAQDDGTATPDVTDGSQTPAPSTDNPSPSPSASSSAPAPGDETVSPDQVKVRVLDRHEVEPAGGIGLGLEVTRTDGVNAPGQVQVGIDYSGFKYAYGADFASRLRLVKLPACALDTPSEEGCSEREFVSVDNDTKSATLTATVTAAADTGPAGTSAQLIREAVSGSASVYALTSSSSSDAGDYRASSLSPSGSWDVSTGSGAFNYNLPIQVPTPPMGSTPSLAMTYNSQSVDGRTSASNNQASWAGMGWDLNVGYIERRYRNCAEDGLPTIGDMCWDSPNSAVEPSGAAYVININGTTSELIQDNNGTGAYHLQDDPGWRVQRLFDGYGAGRDGEYWVISTQAGQRYYFGWGRSERTNTATASVFTVPVVGNDAGEPCHDQFPEPCTQAWRWNLDRVVDANEVESMYFYDKEYNHYRSVANTDKAREYVSSGYVKEIQYGWASQITDGKVPAKVELSHVNRCIERVQETDPLRDEPASCPTFDDKPTSYPDVPVDLLCDGTSADYYCAGKTYSPTFFSTDMLWDIKTYVSDQDGSDWDLVQQYQNKYGMPNPDGTVGKTLWLDYVQRKSYGDGTDLVLPVINFNREDLDNKVGSAELNFPRIHEIHGDLGATTTVSYGFANACDIDHLPSQASNTQDCFWQKWTPEGETEAKTGWFKKFLVTKVEVDPTVTTNQDGAPVMTTSYTYQDGAGWRFTNDPLTKDENESWSDWRGYQEVEVTTGANTGKKTMKYWQYRGLDGDRTSKTDPSATKSVTVNDGDGNNYPDHAWLAGKTLSTSLRDNTNTSHERTYHTYWDHNTAQYDGLPDARFVRDARTTTKTLIKDGSWREHVVESEYDDNEAASTTFGLPMRTDDWGESDVSDNRCTTYGRSYNTDNYDSTGAQRWTVLQDQVKHYKVGCSSIADSNQDGYTSTLYDNSASVADNKPTDGNPTEVRTYTKAGTSRTVNTGYDKAGRATWTEDGYHKRTTTTFNPVNTWPLNGITITTPDPEPTDSARGPLTSTTWMSRFWGLPTTMKDANGNSTKVTLDAAGRITEVWEPTETGNSPSLKFTYTIPTSTNSAGVPDSVDGYPHVATHILQSGTTYLSSHAYSDGLGRDRESQTPLPSDIDPVTRQLVPYRQVAVTRYDSAGGIAGTSAVFRNQGTAGSGGPSSPEPADLPSYNDLVLDWAGRTVTSQIRVKNVAQDAGRVDTTYDGDFTSVKNQVDGATDTYTDVYGQISKVVEHSDSATYTTAYTYTGKGELAQIADPRGNTTRYTYDWAGQRKTTDDPDTGTSSAEYNDNGQISTTTATRNDIATTLTYGYDALGRQTSVKNGTTELAAWTWDDPAVTGSKGQITASVGRDANGNAYTTKIGKFDARGRALNTTTTLPSTVNGLAGSYTTAVTYDAADHIATVTYPAAGTGAARLDPETVTTTYDDYGRPTRLTSSLSNTVYIDNTTYDAYDRLSERNYGAEFGGNGTQAQRSYHYNDTNGTRQLTSIATTTTINSLISEAQNDTYTYDNAGKITALREQASGQTAQSQCFRYDAQARLTLAFTHTAASSCANTATTTSDYQGTAPYQTAYSYDRLGNLQSATDTSASGTATVRDYLYPGYDDTGTWTTANADQPHGVRRINRISGGITSLAGTYTYYADGAMKQRTEGSTTTDYTWTKLSQLSTVKTTKTSGSELTRYTYDADGNLVVRTAPQETVASLGGTELRTTDGTNVTATRYYSSGTTAVAMRTSTGNSTTNGKLTYLMADTQASTQLAVDATTGASTRRRYTPFGDQRNGTLPTGTDSGFLGKAEDTSTGLSLLGARAYDPNLGRFISPDPLNTPYTPQNLSAYSYSINNPINYSDPSGLVFSAEDHSDGGNDCSRAEIVCSNEVPADALPDYESGGDDYNHDGYATIHPGVNVPIDWVKKDQFIKAFFADMGHACLPEERNRCYAGDPNSEWAGANAPIAQALLTNLLFHACGEVAGSTCPVAGGTLGEAVAAGANLAAVAGGGEGPGGNGFTGGSSCSRNSFTPDTEIQMADGTTKAIKDVEVGDEVLATNPESGTTEARTVLATIITQEDKDFTELTVRTQHGAAKITATDHHPFWSPSRRAWTDASDLKPGVSLRSYAGDEVTVKTVRSFQAVQETRNLTVDGIHTYYVLAGVAPVLVHNAAAKCKMSNTIGELADRRFGDVLAKRFPSSKVESQFEIWTPYGAREADYAVEDGAGGYHLYEVKSNTSKYTAIQRKKDAWISQNLGWQTTVVRFSQPCPVGC